MYGLDPVLVHHIVNTLGWADLRPLQREAAAPLLTGDDALLLAPTAGGKTEAAVFPLLSKMSAEQWTGTSLLYLCPLKALLNNLHPRLLRYADWTGRKAAIWHGDVTASRRRVVLAERPDILLTTPESLEAMLVSANVDHHAFFAGLRAVVVDEVHAFAGDDRGWHLLAVLERLQNLASQPLQRVGLSATVGNPGELLTWLQGSGVDVRKGVVVAPDLTSTSASATSSPPGDIEVDYVGSTQNAATVIASLHAGEKRLVFCEARRTVEEIGQLLRERGVTTFLSHASLSVDERRRSEEAFAEARDCVIVSTSTLELGIDVGDLDRVIQIDAPSTVASFLQRLGRTGRRADTTRNCLFLTRSGEALTQATGLLALWGRGWVEPVVAPPEPRHIVAQQVMAMCLQEHRIGDHLWKTAWNGLPPFDDSSAAIVDFLAENEFLDSDGGMLFIGPAAEKRFGFRHFMDMTAVFTGPPEFGVFLGREELGRIGPSLLTEKVPGDRRLLLAGRSWKVTYIDWRRRRCFVEPADGGGKARWATEGVAGRSFALTRAMRDVLRGTDPPVRLTPRAVKRLAEEREKQSSSVHGDGTAVVRDRHGELRWWTWAGGRTNATLAATLPDLVDPVQRFDDRHLRLRADIARDVWRQRLSEAATHVRLPEVDEKALDGLKFSAALPPAQATATLSRRLADLEGAAQTLAEISIFVSE